MPISNVSGGLRTGVCTSTTRPSAPYEGQVIYETDTDKLLVWDASAWKPLPIVSASGASTVMTAKVGTDQGQMPFALATGAVNVTTSAAYQNTYYGVSGAITFPANRFTQIPRVIANVAGGGYGWASSYNASTTGFSYIWLVADTNATTRQCDWFAIQMISTSGSG